MCCKCFFLKQELGLTEPRWLPSVWSGQWCALEMCFSCCLACDKASVDQGNPWKLLVLPKAESKYRFEGHVPQGSMGEWLRSGLGRQNWHPNSTPSCCKIAKIGYWCHSFPLSSPFSCLSLTQVLQLLCYGTCRRSARVKTCILQGQKGLGLDLGEREEGGKLGWDGAGSWF